MMQTLLTCLALVILGALLVAWVREAVRDIDRYPYLGDEDL